MPALRIGARIPALKEFSQYLAGALVFLMTAAGAQALHLVANGAYVVYQQATYVSHFSFFAAMSLLFLAFGKMANIGIIPIAGDTAPLRDGTRK
jgi:hypothetical protein